MFRSLMVSTIVVCQLLLAPGAGVSYAQSDEELLQARQKGIEYIRSKQLEDGSWAYEGHAVGITALCALSMIENGVPIQDPAITKAQSFVRKNLGELKQTYDIALSILLLNRIGDRNDRGTIRDLAARLIAGQLTSGGWTYTCPIVSSSILRDPKQKPAPKVGPGDNSCTQFAVLGLWTASRSGVNIDSAMEAVAARFADGQLEDGGWPYKEGSEKEPAVSRSSMTFAGLFCLTVARATRIRAEQKEAERRASLTTSTTSRSTTSRSSTATRSSTAPTTTPAAESAGSEEIQQGQALIEYPIFAKGLKRAGEFVQGRDSARYFLWSVERLGVLLGLEKFGDVDWFAKGSQILLKAQRADGSWPESRQDSPADTAFAILFLRKANLGSDISRLLQGEPEQPFQIITQDGKPRFDRIEEAVAASKPGDIIRIDGDGPHRVPHLDISHNLTLQAGFGYEPVFVYDIGYDPGGLRSRPDQDAEVRHILRTLGGTLTLEGIKFEMDAPEVGRTVSWSAIVAKGGDLQVLNCTITEGNRKGMAGVQIIAPGKVRLRNTIVGGGRTAIEVLARGKQEVTAENCLLYSRNGVQVLPNFGAPDTSAECSVSLSQCVVHSTNAYHLPNLVSKLAIQSTGTLYKVNSLGPTLFLPPQQKPNRSFAGEANVYDVSLWPGNGVTDVESWSRYWNQKDVSPVSKIITFAIRRPDDAYSHRLRPQDWELTGASPLPSKDIPLGIEPLTVGSGEGFSRFRDSILYNDWQSERPELAAAQP